MTDNKQTIGDKVIMIDTVPAFIMLESGAVWVALSPAPPTPEELTAEDAQ